MEEKKENAAEETGAKTATHHNQKGNIMKTLMKMFNENYTAPNMWKLMLESTLLAMVIASAVVLAYAGKMSEGTVAVILAAVLGFLFGKMR